PSRLRIMTIDAFCASLVGQMQVLSRFGAAQAINPSPAPLYRRAARRLLGALEDDPETGQALALLLGHLDNDRRRVESLVEAMLGSRDRWLPLVVGSDRPELMRDALEDTLKLCCERALAQAADRLPDDVAEQILEFLPAAADQVDDDRPLAACRGMDALPSPTVENLGRWRGIRALLLKADGAPRKRLSVKEGFPAASGARDAEEKERRNAAKQQALDTLSELESHPGFCAALAALDDVPAVDYEERQWNVLAKLMTLLPRAAAELLVLFQEVGEIDFTEQSRRALEALGPADAPTDLALALDYRISHLLIDEFQDTSRSQFELAQRLVAGWQPGDGRTPFLVGDPMQSIYRFRDADVGLFLEARSHGLGGIALEPLTLKANFRSRPALVDANNEVFAQIFPSEADPREGAVTFSAADAQRSLGGTGLHVHGLPDGTADDEAAAVVACVQEALSASDDGDIAILVRGRTHLARIMPALVNAGVVYQAVDIVPLRHSPVVIDLWSLTRALLHLADRTAWLAILRAPWCGLTLADLHALVGDAPHRTVWECLLKAPDAGAQVLAGDASSAALSEEGLARVAQLKAVLNTAFAARGRRDLRRWIEGVWRALGGPKCLTSDHERRNAETYLALLESLDDGGDGLRPEDLERAVDDLYAETPADDATRVRIMTIHKAKGLEFDTVILPGLHRAPPPSDNALMHWLEFADDQGQLRRLLAPIASATAPDDVTVSYVRKIERERERAESLRLLYVAATRAREALHLFACCALDDDGHTRAPRTGTLLNLFWPALGEAFSRDVEAHPPEPTVTEPVPTGPPPLLRLPRPSLGPDTSQGRPWCGQELVLPVDGQRDLDWAGDSARHVGTAVHRVLQQVAQEGINVWIGRWSETLETYLDR
ncbi:MAG: 3'-5' exonuclease, partial [Pseudomonadota bacterium]